MDRPQDEQEADYTERSEVQSSEYTIKKDDLEHCPKCHWGVLTIWFEENEAHQYVENAECPNCGATFTTQ